MDTHRVRRVRWQARAPGTAEAFALRALLRENADACEAALARAFDSVASPGEVRHLPRLELTLRLADVGDVDRQGLAGQVEAALRAALADAAAAVGAAESARDVRTAGPERAAAAPDDTPHRQVAVERREALRHYLARGVLPWTLAGLAPEQAQRELADAALEAAEAVVDGHADLAASVPDAGAAARIGALARWLPLLPPALRSRWIAARPAPVALDADIVADWRHWIDDDGAERVGWQALWLAGPLPAAELQRQIAAQRRAGAAEPSFAPRLSASLAAATGIDDDAPILRLPDVRARHSPSATPAAVPLPSLVPRGVAPAGVDAPTASHPFATAAPTALLVPLAGLVLLHPWLPRLLAACGVLEPGGRRVAPDQLSRGCMLLHALACGDRIAAEHELPLVKLLLGRPPDEPLAVPPVPPTATDRAEIDALLGAVREHWSALRGTAVDGLRLSFLQRSGLLSHADGAWQLRMQPEAFDLLLGLLPWSIGLVRLPWMPEPLVVEWPTP